MFQFHEIILNMRILRLYVVLSSSWIVTALISSKKRPGSSITILQNIKVLGLIFDHKMSWDDHVEKLLKEANSWTQAIRRAECLNVAHGLVFSSLYYCSRLTDMLSITLMKRVTISSCTCLRAVFGYRIKDISTKDLPKPEISLWKGSNVLENHYQLRTAGTLHGPPP